METIFTFKFFENTNELPDDWHKLAENNIFFSKKYLQVLEHSSPQNMTCRFIGIYQNDILEGISLTQLINLSKVSSFGVTKNCLKAAIRDFVFKNFASNVLFVGNNMVTGQNAYVFSNNIADKDGIVTLKKAVSQLKKEYKLQRNKVHITSFKDFAFPEKNLFKTSLFKKYFEFNTQPNMVFTNQESWINEEDYVASLNKKYRDQYKRARKKSELILKKQMNLDEILSNQNIIYNLYLNVSKNAPFNTFYLAENHFSNLKELLEEKFLFYGYFLNDKLIGFNTMIVNGNILDTYFLGYDVEHQKEKMLYLNMLYDMIGYAITKKYTKLIFSRTALEIKSSVGAKPIEMVGFVSHSNVIINIFIGRLFTFFDPKVGWIERNPFK